MSAKDFQLISKLGEGAFSSVWKAKRLSDGQEYAMKIVKFTSLSEKEKQNAINEVRILASINHPCVIGYKEAFFEDNPLSLCVVMEHAGGGDILNRINQHQKGNTFFREEDIWRFSVQMIMGLKALHDMKILHRDLKCANIFLSTDGRTTKLGDLNVSKVAKGELAYTQTGTPYYASPEVWRDEPYDLKSDIWSLGCVIYEMCAHKPPFRASDMPGLFKKIQRGVFDRIPSQYSIDLYNLISICLQVKPGMRPTCDQLLAHPIVQRNAGRYIQDIADTPGMESLNELLGTIRMPANIKALAQRLPKANYTPTPPPFELERGRPDSAHRRVGIQTKRPTSQCAPAPYSKIIPKVRESHSRDSRITHVVKADPIAPRETEREYLLRMQKEYIDKARAIKPADFIKDQKSPRQQENIILQKSPHRPLSGRKLVDNPPRERVDTRGSEAMREEPGIRAEDYINGHIRKSKVLDARRPTEDGQKMEANMPTIRQRPLSREKRPVEEIMPDKAIMNRQDYLINKYQSTKNSGRPEETKIVLPRVMSEKDHLIRRADYLLEKYQPSDPVKRDPVVGGGEVKRPIITPSKGTRREASDIMEKYANILNMKEGGKIVSNEKERVFSEKERPLGRRKVEGQPGEHNINLYSPRRNVQINNENNSKNANLIKQQARMKVDVRPLNWG